jgi:hypothetical protein
MTFTLIAARRHEVATNIETLPPTDRESDIPDELGPKLVMNTFVDDKLVETFRTDND